MKNPKSFLLKFGVLNVSMCIVTFLYTFLGFFGYWRYGAAAEGSITLNLPEGEL